MVLQNLDREFVQVNFPKNPEAIREVDQGIKANPETHPDQVGILKSLACRDSGHTIHSCL